MPDDVTSTAEQETTTEATEPTKPQGGDAKPKAKAAEVNELLLEKKSELEKDNFAYRRKLAEAATREEALARENAALKLEKAKRAHVTAAKQLLGNDFHIPAEKEAEIETLVDAFQNSDALADNIARLVKGFAQPVKAEAKPGVFTPFTKPAAGGTGSSMSGPPQKDAHDYTTAELQQIYKSDPERYKQLRAERAQPRQQKG